jgi:signal transduction histidine kinase
MRLGYELLREQQFFRKELRERVHWFIQLRWVAASAALAAVWSGHYLGLDLPLVSLTRILLLVLAYNILFWGVAKRLGRGKTPESKPFAFFVHIQICFDLSALSAMIYFTGGISSALLPFTLFHIILAGLLLSPTSCFAYAGVVLVVLAVFVEAERRGLVYQQIALKSATSAMTGREAQVWIGAAVFSIAVLISAFLITTIKRSLRTKGRELLQVSQELEASNAKLNALYDMVKAMGTHTDLQGLMDTAARFAARIMGVRACAVKLLEEDRRTLRFAATYGLSEDYLAAKRIDLEKSPVNLRVVQGSPFAIGKIQEKDFFQYPEEIEREGIAAMLCLPLRVEKMILGIFCVYSDRPHQFDEREVEFFALMSDLTALAIENLRTHQTRTWFMLKAAHQLRSPLNAVMSMVKTLRKGYLGEMTPGQTELLERCERRIELLNGLLNDLLKLARERETSAGTELHPVNPKDRLHTMEGLFRAQAADKGLEIAFTMEDSIPEIQADESLLDEIFSNLISNAVKYTPPKGRIQVRLDAEDEQVRFEVADTGIGIPEKDLARLFSEFFRAENAKAMTEDGTGLGMVIVKEMVDRLRGRLSVESKEGQGTRVRCFFPLI